MLAWTGTDRRLNVAPAASGPDERIIMADDDQGVTPTLGRTGLRAPRLGLGVMV